MQQLLKKYIYLRLDYQEDDGEFSA